MATEEDEREEELGALTAIFPELIIDPQNPYVATLELPVTPRGPLLIRFLTTKSNASYSETVQSSTAYIEHDVTLSHLPPLTVHLELPSGYPSSNPPEVHLSAHLDWLPDAKLKELTAQVANLWEDYGRCQILYSYIDYLQQAAESAFDLNDNDDGCLILPPRQEADLLAYDQHTRRAVFEAGTYDCGVCLDPKKGSSCHRMDHCHHVFCRQCLQDFYNNAIAEGNIAGIRCLEPTCGSGNATRGPADAASTPKRRSERTLSARELLEMGVAEDVVRRYIEMKRKKKLEADKSTVYCPRTWCQGPAKSSRYPPIPRDLAAYVAVEAALERDDAEGTAIDATASAKQRIPPDPSDRLAVCEKCSFAFCRVCYMGWHGPFARCYPRDPNELSEEEKASYEYIRLHTSPCAYCNAPVQKTMGCNHMCCFQCNTHFCYLCGAWLDPASPYQHYNKQGTPCFQRLWQLEEGDEGQGPRDGQGFGGGRAWEQLAIEVARAADEAEAEAAAADAQAAELERAVEVLQLDHERVPAVPPIEAERQHPVVLAIAQEPAIAVEALRGARGPRRRMNPFVQRPAPGGAERARVVRDHERAGLGARRPLGVAANGANGRNGAEERRQAELQRFLEMAQRDEEDGWDSDELGENDDGFVIR